MDGINGMMQASLLPLGQRPQSSLTDPVGPIFSVSPCFLRLVRSLSPLRALLRSFALPLGGLTTTQLWRRFTRRRSVEPDGRNVTTGCGPIFGTFVGRE